MLGGLAFITVFTTALALAFALALVFGNGGAAMAVFAAGHGRTIGGPAAGSRKQRGPDKYAVIGSMVPVNETSDDGADGAVQPIGAGEIVLVDSAVGSAMLVSGAALAVLVESSAGADNGCSGAPGPKGEIGPLRADGRCKSVNNVAGAAAKASAGPGTSGASVICNASAGRVTTSGCMLKAGKLRRCHKGIALRNIKRRTLKLASVRRDKHRHDYGFDLASGFASGWVNISVDIDAG